MIEPLTKVKIFKDFKISANRSIAIKKGLGNDLNAYDIDIMF